MFDAIDGAHRRFLVGMGVYVPSTDDIYCRDGDTFCPIGIR